jgi:predicted DNA binding protein
MIDARFRIELPPGTWVGEVSRATPDATFRLLSGLRTGDRAVELGEVVADDPIAVGDSIADHRFVEAYQRLESADRRLLARYETTDTALYEFARSVGVPVEFPVVVRNGWYEFDVTGTRDELDALRDTLDASPLSFELLSLVRTDEDEDLLTARQRELLDAALRAGYFDVPRECTLGDLAADFDVDKSTLSRTLRRGQAQVLRWYLTGSQSTTRSADGDR